MDINAAPVPHTKHKRFFLFSGTVLPERKAFNIERRVFSAGMRNEHGEVRGFFDIAVINSFLSCSFSTDDNIPDIDTFRNGIKNLIEYNLHIISYAYDISILGIDIIQIYDSMTDVVTLQDSVRQAECTLASHFTESQISLLPNLYPELFEYLRIALSDYNSALLSVNSSGFYCYRAIETLMHSIKTINGTPASDSNRSASWERFRNAIKGDRSRIDFIKEFAELERHGIPVVLTSYERERILDDTKKIVDNYIHYITEAYQQNSETT